MQGRSIRRLQGYLNSHDKPQPSLLRLNQVILKKAKNITQFAKSIGVGPSAVYQNLYNNRPISRMWALAIEAEYGVSHQWLLEGEEKPLGKQKRELKNLNQREVANFNSEAYARYKSDGPQYIGDSETEIPAQTIFYDPNVPLEELTEEHFWLGGTSTPKVLVQLIQRLQQAEARIAELEKEKTS